MPWGCFHPPGQMSGSTVKASKCKASEPTCMAGVTLLQVLVIARALGRWHYFIWRVLHGRDAVIGRIISKGSTGTRTKTKQDNKTKTDRSKYNNLEAEEVLPPFGWIWHTFKPSTWRVRVRAQRDGLKAVGGIYRLATEYNPLPQVSPQKSKHELKMSLFSVACWFCHVASVCLPVQSRRIDAFVWWSWTSWSLSRSK